MEPRYKTLAELVAAYRRGEKLTALVLDNDSTTAYLIPDDPDDDNWELAFSMHPDELLLSALDMLGVPHEHV